MDERQIAETMIADAKTMAEEGQAKLDELDKPELRHGDYGISYGKEHNSISFPMLAFQRDTSGCPLRIAHKDGSGGWQEADGDDDITWLGNIFDDLKRNSVDLKEFEIGYKDGDKNPRIKCRLGDSGIQLTIDNTYFTANISPFQKFHQKLGQLICTAKRQKAKG